MSRKLLVLLILCLIGIFVGYRLSEGRFDWPLFVSSLSNLLPGWLLASVVVTLSTYVVRAFRWKVLLAPIKQIGMKTLVETTVVGFAAIYLLGRPAELARPLWLTRREGIPLTSSLATIIVERVIDTLMLIAVFALALLTVEVSAGSGTALATMKEAAWFIVAVSVGVTAGFVALRSHSARIVGCIPFPRVAALVASFAQGLGFLQSGRGLALTLMYSVLLWFAIPLQFWLMLRGMRFDLPPEAATLVLVGAAIGSLAQIPGIGGGFQAGFVFCMATFFLIPAEQAIAASLIAWVFSYAPTVLAAAIYMLIQGFSIRELKDTIRKPQSQMV